MSNEGELLVGILSDLVFFPSINGSENELSDYLSHLFEGMGLNSYQQVAANGMKNAIGSVCENIGQICKRIEVVL